MCRWCLDAWVTHPDPDVRLEALTRFAPLLDDRQLAVLAGDGDLRIAAEAARLAPAPPNPPQPATPDTPGVAGAAGPISVWE